MKRTEAETLTLAGINLDGQALCEAALIGDWDEARFRCHLVTAGAADAGLVDIALTATKLADLLSPVGDEPRPGYGAVMRLLAGQLGLAA